VSVAGEGMNFHRAPDYEVIFFVAGMLSLVVIVVVLAALAYLVHS
jgi:hypothetical protein